MFLKPVVQVPILGAFGHILIGEVNVNMFKAHLWNMFEPIHNLV
jgi:hypothetical protein